MNRTKMVNEAQDAVAEFRKFALFNRHNKFSGWVNPERRRIFMAARFRKAERVIEKHLSDLTESVEAINDDPMTSHYGIGGEICSPYFRTMEILDLELQSLDYLYSLVTGF